MPNVALPVHLSATPVVDPVAAPALGAHTTEILETLLGYDAQRMADLAAEGAFGTQDAPAAGKGKR